ncbi:MAG: hypothetical protein ABIV06_06125 [Thermoanaerobaculia bacterium]
MTRAGIARGASATLVVLIAVAAAAYFLRPASRPVATTASGISPSDAPSSRPPDRPVSGAPQGETAVQWPDAAAEDAQGFLYGRITTVDGAVFEGRLRWGGVEEAFWDDLFNGTKSNNPWLAMVAPERRPVESHPLEIFGIKIAQRERPSEVSRPFLARFGEIARLDARGDEVRVTLRSGSVVDLDRFEASDFDDDVRVWDGRRGVVDLDSLRIRTIEFLPTPALGDLPVRLYGKVRTGQGDFTGFIGWNREECVGTDELDGDSASGEKRLRFDSIRSIVKLTRDSSEVKLADGSEIVLTGNAEVGEDNRGIYIGDRRYGRVLVSWAAFERIDFRPIAARTAHGEASDGSEPGDASDLGDGANGPAYEDFPPGRPLIGSVTTRDGRRLAGRLVFDLDESETTDTLDAPSLGVDYTVPFGRIAAIEPITSSAPAAAGSPSGGEERGAPNSVVSLYGGETLRLERAGDLGPANAGMLIFVEGAVTPEYVPWSDVAQIDFERPPAIHPALNPL